MNRKNSKWFIASLATLLSSDGKIQARHPIRGTVENPQKIFLAQRESFSNLEDPHALLEICDNDIAELHSVVDHMNENLDKLHAKTPLLIADIYAMRQPDEPEVHYFEILLGEYSKALSNKQWEFSEVQPFIFEIDNDVCNELKEVELLKKKINRKNYEMKTGENLVAYFDFLLGGEKCRETIEAHSLLLRNTSDKIEI